MTVSVVPTWVQTPGNGAATVYNFPFLITAVTDLVVGFIIGGNYTQQNIGFTISFTPSIQGGQVTFTTPPTLGTTVDIRSLLPQTQPTNFANLGAYYPENATNASDRGTRLSSDMYRLTYQFGIHGPDTEGTPWPVLPPPAQRLGMGLVFDTVTGLPGVGTLTPTPLTQSGFNGLLGGSNLGNFFYPALAGESGIVNPYKPYFDVDRYGYNALPGVTPMDGAFQAAYNACIAAGGGTVTYNSQGSGPYLLNNPINCTYAGTGNTPPVIWRNFKPDIAGHPPAGCILNHNSIGFDCTGNITISFIDMTITTQLFPVPVNIPKIGILLARNSPSQSLVNRIVRPRMVGYFSIACIYNYGSEGLPIETGYFSNYGAAGAGNCCLAITSGNYANVSSIIPGLIATGNVSMTIGGAPDSQMIMNGASSTSDCVHLEGASDMSFRDAFCFNLNGRSAIYIDPSKGNPSNFNTIDGMRIDDAGGPKYGVFSDTSSTSLAHIGWNIRGFRCNASMFAIAFADANTYPYNWTVDPISEKAPAGGISIPGKIDGFSQFRLGATVLTVGSVTQGNWIVGYPPNITVSGVTGGVGLGSLDSNYAAQINGFGTPTGAALTTNFPGATASLTQTSEMVALILQIMKQQGSIAT